jgi:shikimate kinase / 3-dehydroquinate synthase
MPRNNALSNLAGPVPGSAHTSAPGSASWAGRSIVLIGLMGAGKTSIGRRLAARLGLPFRDADAEIEAAAGCTVADLFARFGESAFRDGERRVVRRLLEGPPIVLATGGGAWMDPETRATVRRLALSVWLRAALPVLVARTAGRAHRPLLAGQDVAATLAGLARVRHPVYAEADIIVDCAEEPPEVTTTQVQTAIESWQPPRRLTVQLARPYDVVVGTGLLARAGALLGPVLPQKRAIIIADATVAALHLATLQAGLDEAGFIHHELIVPPGEKSKSLASYTALVEQVLELRPERRTAIIVLGGGVVGDLAGFAAASVLRGLPFVQVPTTLLSQVDSSVGGKTAVNARQGKNLVGAFWQPHAVLADTATLATLPRRELLAGYAEIVKSGLIGDPELFEWCEAHGAAVIGGDPVRQAEAVLLTCAFKAAVVGDDEREEKPNDGRALLNLGHTFGHALEAEFGFDGRLLHGEAVAMGCGLAFRLSARLDLCTADDATRVATHLESVGLSADLRRLNTRLSAARLIDHMRHDKKTRDGALTFVLVRGIGRAFTSRDVPEAAVTDLLLAEGCAA